MRERLWDNPCKQLGEPHLQVADITNYNPNHHGMNEASPHILNLPIIISEPICEKSCVTTPL